MSRRDLNIRPVSPADLNDLVEISRTTFYQTFADVNTEEDMKEYLETNLSLAQLSKELADPSSLFFFAVEGSEICGYFKVNFEAAQTVSGQTNSLELERIYVSEKRQGKGAGRIMLEGALKIARDNDLNDLWLGVWERNPKAIRFYERNGFTIFGKHIFRLGNDDQTDLLMRRKV